MYSTLCNKNISHIQLDVHKHVTLNLPNCPRSKITRRRRKTVQIIPTVNF